LTYFDHNATHPLSAAAREAWLDAVERHPANPSSPHRLGARADLALEEARERVAALLGCRLGEVIFTSGASEANNTLVYHLSRASEDRLLVSGIEHPSMLAAVRRWFAGRFETIPCLRNGVIDFDGLQAALDRGPVAGVLVMAANNETGVLQPWDEVRNLCEARGAVFGCDAAQWVGKLPARGLGSCGLVTGSGHKFGGPAGVGFLKGPGNLAGLLVGGPQEDGRRAGTENVAGVLAMVAAWNEREQQLAAGTVEERTRWRDAFVARLSRAVPGIEVLGEPSRRLWNTVSVLMPEAPCDRRWVVKLDRLGFAVSTGSACSSGREKASHVLLAMGRSGPESARMLRFSAGWETRLEDWDALLDALTQACQG